MENTLLRINWHILWNENLTLQLSYDLVLEEILHNKTFFSNILIKIATANKQRNITQHKKSFFNIILIEMATANVQENITQHKKNIFLA